MRGVEFANATNPRKTYQHMKHQGVENHPQILSCYAAAVDQAPSKGLMVELQSPGPIDSNAA